MTAIGQGNTFDTTTQHWGHARKVWRSVEHTEPSGGTVSNISDWVAKGVIPAGTPVKFDHTAKTIVAITDAAITAATDVTTLGINGYSLDDVRVSSADTIGTIDVVYAGFLYEYMYDSAILAKLKTLTNMPMIHWGM